MNIVFQEGNHAVVKQIHEYVDNREEEWYYCCYQRPNDNMWYSHLLDNGSPVGFQRFEKAIAYVQNIVIDEHHKAIPANRNYKSLEEKIPRSYGTAYWNRQYETARFNAWGFGYDYMRGIVSVEDMRTFLLTEGLRWPYLGFTDNCKHIRKGVRDAIAQNVAIPSRIQPEQPDAEQIALWKKEKRSKKA